MTTSKSYKELSQYSTFEERFRYLSLRGSIGRSTFGFDRWVNQRFYSSWEWRKARRDVIARDEGCDLGVPGHEIFHRLVVHHMNPVLLEDIENGAELILNPDFMITTTHDTHNAIHYGDLEYPKRLQHKPRSSGDTKLW
jgi:hypothetical protein